MIIHLFCHQSNDSSIIKFPFEVVFKKLSRSALHRLDKASIPPSKSFLKLKDGLKKFVLHTIKLQNLLQFYNFINYVNTTNYIVI